MYPNSTAEEQLEYSHRDFNNAAKMFMLETLKACKKLRPVGKWGYYRFPDCHNQFNGDTKCDEKAVTWACFFLKKIYRIKKSRTTRLTGFGKSPLPSILRAIFQSFRRTPQI